MNAFTWLLWGLSILLFVSLTRNPWYLGLLALSVLAVEVSVASGTTVRRGLVASGWISVVSTLFNLLTAHVGNIVILQLPASWPIIGGPLTLNALIYGLCNALALFLVVTAGVTMYTALNWFDVLRLAPPGLSSVVVTLALAGSILPAATRSFREIREAQALRGTSTSWSLRLTWLLAGMLHRGFHHALALAETLECRGYGHTRPSWKEYSALLCLGSGALGFVFSLLNPHRAATVAASIVALAGVGLFAWLLWPRLARLTWRWPHRLSLLASLLSLVLVLTTLIVRPAVLRYTPYPVLTPPPLAVLPSLAAVLLACPVLTTGTDYGTY